MIIFAIMRLKDAALRENSVKNDNYIFFYKKLLTKIYFYATMRMNIPLKLLESQETKSGGSSGESRKSAEGARSFE